jgi:hypothetical protein
MGAGTASMRGSLVMLQRYGASAADARASLRPRRRRCFRSIRSPSTTSRSRTCCAMSPTLGDAGRACPGGLVAALGFGVPQGPARPLWDLYVRTVLPLAGRLLRRSWQRSATSWAGRSATYTVVHDLTPSTKAGETPVQSLSAWKRCRTLQRGPPLGWGCALFPATRPASFALHAPHSAPMVYVSKGEFKAGLPPVRHYTALHEATG